MYTDYFEGKFLRKRLLVKCNQNSRFLYQRFFWLKMFMKKDT